MAEAAKAGAAGVARDVQHTGEVRFGIPPAPLRFVSRVNVGRNDAERAVGEQHRVPQGSAGNLLVDIGNRGADALQGAEYREFRRRDRMQILAAELQKRRQVFGIADAVESGEPGAAVQVDVTLGPLVAGYPQQVGQMAVVPEGEGLQVFRGAGHLHHQQQFRLSHCRPPSPLVLPAGRR